MGSVSIARISTPKKATNYRVDFIKDRVGRFDPLNLIEAIGLDQIDKGKVLFDVVTIVCTRNRGWRFAAATRFADRSLEAISQW